MSHDSILAFWERVRTDLVLQQELVRLDQSQLDADAAGERVRAIAAAAGFHFTRDEYDAALRSQFLPGNPESAMSLGELDQVAGGAGAGQQAIKADLRGVSHALGYGAIRL
jgi:predicted ribosomally synthesized peptide with nif11-like leader